MYMCMTKQYYRVRSLLHDRQYISNMQSRVYMCVFVHVRVRVDFISCLCGCTAEEVPASKPYVPPGRREMLKDSGPRPRSRDQARFYPVPVKQERPVQQQQVCVWVGGREGGGGGGGGGGLFFSTAMSAHCPHSVSVCVTAVVE